MSTAQQDNYFLQLSSISVSGHVEKKGQFSYLSWPFAVSQLRQFDPTATWDVQRFNGLPYLATDLGVFVEVCVTVKGISLSQIHPVLDSRNRPIMAPTAFDINTSIQRCLVKAIALHGLGLSIYAGEDLPLGDNDRVVTPTEAATPRNNVSELASRPHTTEQSGDKVTGAQVRYIERLIDEAGTQLQRVLDYCGVERLEDISKSEASRVIRSLEQTCAKKEAA